MLMVICMVLLCGVVVLYNLMVSVFVVVVCVEVSIGDSMFSMIVS